ncbi:MAG: chromosomal replication initiator protein DnaA, partial [Oscillospiraceae bacterium]|nr:chromosomal replication initiator protein DnaA [Oscillospiraceae bacterium]
IYDINENSDYQYTFDNFIVGSTNSFAYAACKAVSQHQSGAYNPLFIYGPSGMGKTHLLLAIRHKVKNTNPALNVVYINGEAFTNEFITAIEQEKTREFHEKYRNVDFLLMDDIQFLAGKIQTQEEFFYTFNELHQIGKQIVLTSDRPPKDIKTLENRLRTRFEWGLLADIAPSDFETRVAIVRRKAQLLQIDIPDEVINYIAKNLKNNIRQLEGAVKKIKAYKLLADSSPSIAMAQSVIRDILNDDQPTPVTIEKIISEVSRTFNVSESDIRSTKRQSQIAKARHISIYVVREITQLPYEEIGKEFSNRDHSTITHSLKKVEMLIKKDSKQKEIIEDI